MLTGETLRILTKEQKIGFALLLCFGLIVVVLGVLQLRNTIYSPFVIHAPDQTSDLAALFQNNEARLQQIDTDHDGLNDYEELNFYSTSPYLPDTDSDGISDKDEIAVGSDPNCPSGQTCQSVSDLSKGSTGEISTPPVEPILPQSSATISASATPAQNGDGFAGLSEADWEAIIQNPALFRELLLQTGKITKEQLDKIPDNLLVEQAKTFMAEKRASESI